MKHFTKGFWWQGKSWRAHDFKQCLVCLQKHSDLKQSRKIMAQAKHSLHFESEKTTRVCAHACISVLPNSSSSSVFPPINSLLPEPLLLRHRLCRQDPYTPNQIPGMPGKKWQGKYVNHRGVNTQMNWITTLENQIFKMRIISITSSSWCLKGNSARVGHAAAGKLPLKADAALILSDKPTSLRLYSP